MHACLSASHSCRAAESDDALRRNKTQGKSVGRDDSVHLLASFIGFPFSQKGCIYCHHHRLIAALLRLCTGKGPQETKLVTDTI